MNGRLSNSELLKQIIPQTMKRGGMCPKKNTLCTTRTVQPIELISKKKSTDKQESKVNQGLLEKIQELKASTEFDNIVKGSRLGLKAYQKPSTGIPLNDLSDELKVFVQLTRNYMSRPEKKINAFGKVQFDKDTKVINFYSEDDTNMSVVLGSVDLTDLQADVRADIKINSSSTNAVANSAVAKSLKILQDMIPKITVSEETLKINNN